MDHTVRFSAANTLFTKDSKHVSGYLIVFEPEQVRIINSNDNNNYLS